MKGVLQAVKYRHLVPLSNRDKGLARSFYIKRCSSSNATNDSQYDLVVIGGGSGGLACAKEASDLGAKVAVLDYVEPSVQGSVWGLGGTCVNVGCIPKKLMHHAALQGHVIQDSRMYGWKVNDHVPQHDWFILRDAVRNYIKSLNWGHRVQLKEKSIDYVNGFGEFIDEGSVRAVQMHNKSQVLKSKNFVVATGTRPTYPAEIEGVHHCISSDDLFSLDKPPGKTIVIGASYVALECAGLLSGLGYHTTVLMRSIPLRGFDREMSELVVRNMSEQVGTHFIRPSVPLSIDKLGDGGFNVKYKNTETGTEVVEQCDTVLLAIGRLPQTSRLALNSARVDVDERGFIIGCDGERSSNPNIYAIGDILKGCPQLTPVAVKAGRLLSRRLFAGSHQAMDYENVATTVFTPIEYGCVGLSEEEAEEKIGADSLEIYHAFYKPLDYGIAQRRADECYIKCICERGGEQKVLGLHFTGPNAAEVIQGFSAALRAGITWPVLSNTVGIHPSCAEEVVKLRISKRSGESPLVTDC